MMRVSLAPPRPPSVASTQERKVSALFAGEGARVALGWHPRGAAAMPVAPAADTLFAPRGVCLAGPMGPLVVSDTGHHRVLVWRRLPEADNAPADFVMGQPGFASEWRNAGASIGPATFNVPVGVAIEDDVLAVCDSWNHRILIWHGLPGASNRPADIVLGQTDFASGLANRGHEAPRADTLYWCSGIEIHRGRLFVADTGNRRVLAWDRIPDSNGAPADRVFGQRDFATRELGTLRWPHAVCVADRRLLVADAGASRVVAWDIDAGAGEMRCDFVLGQRSLDEFEHNRGGVNPDASTFNMPYGLCIADGRLLVADTANSRVLAFEGFGLVHGAGADALAGQRDFHSRGENGWLAASRSSLCWPFAVSVEARVAAIADTGNNRVLLWDLA